MGAKDFSGDQGELLLAAHLANATPTTKTAFQRAIKSTGFNLKPCPRLPMTATQPTEMARLIKILGPSYG